MNSEALVSLINNVALLLALVVLYDTIAVERKLRVFWSRFLTGIILSVIGITLMVTPWQFAPGVIFDTRSILLSLSGLFFGLMPTMMAAATLSLFRLYQGGAGAWTGVAVALTSASIGLIWRYRSRQHDRQYSWGELYLLGVAVHVTMLLWMLSLPPATASGVLQAISVPVMTIYPVGTVLLGKLLAHQLARQQMKNELRNAKEYAENLIQTAYVMVVGLDIEGTVTVFNRTAEVVTGYRQSELVGKNWFEMMIPGERAAYVRKEFARLIQEGLPGTYESPILTKSGEVRLIAWQNNTVHQNDDIAGTISFGADITERRAEAEKLRLQAEIIKQSPYSIVATDLHGNVTNWNMGAELLFGYSSDEMLGRSIALVYPEDGHHFWANEVIAPMKRQAHHEIEVRLKRQSGNIFTGWLSLWALKDSKDQATGIVGYILDITERIEAEIALRRYNQRLTILREIDQDIVITRSSEAIANSVLKRIRHLIPCQHTSVGLFENGETELVLFATDGDGAREDALHTGTRLPPLHPALHQQLSSGQFVVASDLHAVEETMFPYVEQVRKEGYISGLAAPLLVQEQLIGIFCLSATTPDFFTAEYQEIVKEVANQLAIAIHRNRLLEAERQAYQTMAALLEINQTIAHSLDLDQVLEQFLTTLEHLVPYDSACVMLRDGDQLAVYAMRGYERWGDPQLTQQLRFDIDPDSNPNAYRIVNDQVSVLVPDTRKDPHWIRSAGAHVMSWFGIPLIYGGKVIGRYSVDSVKPGFFTQEHVQQAEILSGVAAAAIENARLYQQVQQHASELEERVRQRTAQLEAINKEMETFTYSVSHDLKAPLRGIDGYSRLLLEDYADKLDADGQMFLQTIRRATLQMSQLIDDLLAYSRLERRPLHPDRIDPQEIVTALLAEHADELATRGIAVHARVPSVRVAADPDGLAIAVRNLLDNAIKFTINIPDPWIEIGGRITDAAYLLWVRDNGIGFDMKFHDRIFKIFQRLHRAEDYPGTGVGLALVHKAMERMGGKAWAESEPGKGATFYLEMPCA